MRKKLLTAAVLSVVMLAAAALCTGCIRKKDNTVWGEWVTEVAATCTTAGSERRTSVNDPTVFETRTVPALGHNLTDVAEVAAGCLTSGQTAYKACTRCDYETEWEYIPALHGRYELTEDETGYICDGVVGTRMEWGTHDCDHDEFDVPATYMGKPVKELGTYAFAHTDYIRRISLPEGLEVIGDHAFFDGSVHITEIQLPDSLKEIGEDAFSGCEITNIIIPDNVTTIGDHAFDFCYHLASVTLGKGVTEIGTQAFSRCNNLVEVYNLSGLDIQKGTDTLGGVAKNAIVVHETSDEESIVSADGEYLFYEDGGKNYLLGFVNFFTHGSVITLPAAAPNGGDYEIVNYAFWDCFTLTGLTIPAAVTKIGDYAFRENGLTALTIHAKSTIIGDYAFKGCYYLTDVTIDKGVTEIGEAAFVDCISLTSIKFNGTSTEWKQINLDRYWYKVRWLGGKDAPIEKIVCNDTDVTL